MNRSVTLRIEERDIVAAQHMLLRRSLRHPVRLTLVVALWVGFTAFMVPLFRDELPQDLGEAIVLAAAIGAPVVFGLPILLVRWLAPRAARRNLRAIPAFQGELHYSWSDEGFGCDTVAGNSLVHWPTYRRWLESDALLLIWPNPVQYQILPKRILGPEQIDDIKRFLIAAKSGTLTGT